MKNSIGFLLPAVLLAGLADSAQAGRQSYCDAYARDVANARVSGGEILAGTIGGAVTGAFLGAVIDGKEGAGKGAIIGGAGGTVIGAVSADGKWHRVYRLAYADCIDLYEPRPVSYEKPVAKPAAKPAAKLELGSEEWINYCESKYNSFDRKTGMYTALSGKHRPCVVGP
jgi:hypothetical protein